MQPYFLPYIGYWQLLNAVDKYVIYDDVNFIKGGWINRNRIINNGKVQFFNVPMIGASPNKLINEVAVNNDPNLINKNLRILEAAYKKAPYFEEGYKLMNKILNSRENVLSKYVTYSLRTICDYLNIKTELIISSELNKDNSLKAQDKVIAICKELGATDYYNAIGGQALYSYGDFDNNGIKLWFIKTNQIQYKQFTDTFEPNLSILDVIMFNSKDRIVDYLNDYSIIGQQDKNRHKMP